MTERKRPRRSYPGYINRMVNFEPSDFQIVKAFALQKGLGRRGFSAALRIIIRQWDQFRRPIPVTKTVADQLRAVSVELGIDLTQIPIINADRDPDPDPENHSKHDPDQDLEPEFVHPPFP